MTNFKKVMFAAIFAAFSLLTSTVNAQTTEEKLEVYELISQYSYMWDTHNVDGLLNLFTDDCTWDWYRYDGKTEVLCKNKEQLKAHAENLMRPKKLLTRHQQTNTIVLDYQNGVIKTRTMVFVTYLFHKKIRKGLFNKPKAIYQGIYEDEFVKTAEGWKFKNRKLISDN